MTLKQYLIRFRSFWIFPSLAVLILYASSQSEPQSDWKDAIWLFPVGLLAWTLLEYGLHRFVFHTFIRVQNPKIRAFVNASHVGHHAAPRDPEQLLVRTPYALVLSTLLFGVIYAVLGNLFSAAVVLVGIWAGFLYYESVHYRVHRSASLSGLIAGQRRRHFYHHFTNRHKCFGVTSPLWDYVFGTGK